MATYYIDPDTGTGTGDGSESDPFANWDEVSWGADDTYLQKRGTTASITATIAPTTNGVTLGAYGTGDRPIIDMVTNDVADACAILFDDITDYTCKDIEVVYSGTTSGVGGNIGIKCVNTAKGTVDGLIDNILIRSMTYATTTNESKCIQANSTDYLTITNCDLSGCGADPIFLNAVSNCEVAHNYLHGFDLNDTSGDGIHSQAVGDNADNNWFHHNTINFSSSGPKGCIVNTNTATTSTGTIIEDNTLIGGNWAAQIGTIVNGKFRRNICTGQKSYIMSAGQGCDVSGNIMVGTAAADVEGVIYQAETDVVSTTLTIANNDFIGLTRPIDGASGYVFANNPTVKLYNNIFDNTDAGGSTRAFVIGGVATLEADYNVYRGRTATPLCEVPTGATDTTPNNFAGLQAEGYETNGQGLAASTSLGLDANYYPESDSPLVGTGTKWWTFANPVGADGEPFADMETDIGAVQGKHSILHPTRL